MQWAVVAGFFSGGGSWRWLDDYARKPGRSFRKVGHVSASRSGAGWHLRNTRHTRVFEWRHELKLALRAMGSEGVVTVFPQLAVTFGFINRTLQLRRRHIAWCFNLGSRPAGLRRRLARYAMKNVDCVVVHSRAETKLIADYLRLPQSRVVFVPLQSTARPAPLPTASSDPFLLAMGSANRDYATLVEALAGTGIPAKIVAAPRLLGKAERPPNIEFLSGLSAVACADLMRSARIIAVTLDDPDIASGQVTIADALMAGCPVIATRSIGTVDYVDHGKTGVLVKPHDPPALRDELLKLWENHDLRTRMSAAGRAFAAAELSDESTGAKLDKILTEIETSELQGR